ncbi:hypothetical protein [Rhodoferax antarcticus]|uniref:hypothetical protein n=1 Tax=Rhodoferax antarcticus TaxID=81479 RepID=UPI0011152635|nr:hypothetical protein [Rhodoferax antarcticus]
MSDEGHQITLFKTHILHKYDGRILENFPCIIFIHDKTQDVVSIAGINYKNFKFPSLGEIIANNQHQFITYLNDLSEFQNESIGILQLLSVDSENSAMQSVCRSFLVAAKLHCDIGVCHFSDDGTLRLLRFKENFDELPDEKLIPKKKTPKPQKKTITRQKRVQAWGDLVSSRS